MKTHDTAQRFYIITGGTMVHIAPHFSLCAPAYGKVGVKLTEKIAQGIVGSGRYPWVQVVPTRMADMGGFNAKSTRELFDAAGIKHLETNDDLSKLIDHLIEQPETRCIVMAAAVCDWEPTDVLRTSTRRSTCEFGKHVPRLKTSEGPFDLGLKPADKILRKIREKRKDIFLVAFKATAGLAKHETYAAGLKLLKQSSANLVLANDVQNRHNMVVTPEEFPYHCDTREDALDLLAEMTVARTQLDFVRTDVVSESRVDVVSLHAAKSIPANFTPVLEHLIENGAYKPFLGKTSGHFGCKVLRDDYDYKRISSIRKVDHNKVFAEGMARIFGYKDGRIQAGGAKPSVGEHTQNQIYELLGAKVHSIVHFHCPLKVDGDKRIPTAPQKAFECGSVQCGTNTATHMREIGTYIWAVHLEGHGPNIAFNKDVPVEKVIEVIKQFWALEQKSGGKVSE